MNTGRRRGFYPSEIDSLPSDRFLTAEIKQAQFQATFGLGGRRRRGEWPAQAQVAAWARARASGEAAGPKLRSKLGAGRRRDVICWAAPDRACEAGLMGCCAGPLERSRARAPLGRARASWPLGRGRKGKARSWAAAGLLYIYISKAFSE
jgi:hypothetical protein